jgi:hypothetical protein
MGAHLAAISEQEKWERKSRIDAKNPRFLGKMIVCGVKRN